MYSYILNYIPIYTDEFINKYNKKVILTHKYIYNIKKILSYDLNFLNTKYSNIYDSLHDKFLFYH